MSVVKTKLSGKEKLTAGQKKCWRIWIKKK